VATISTRRRIRRLRDERRGLVAELCEDTVHGVCHLPGYERETAWTEWELELGPGAVEETVEALVATLTEASGGPSTGGSKLRRTVGDAIPSGGVVPELGQAPSARAVVHARIAEQVRVLLIHDSEVRRDVGDGVHKARVAMRRLRAALATFRPWLDRDATDRLRDELRWAGRALSPVRDAEVMRERFAARLDDQPRAAVIGSVRRDLDNDCRIERRDARKRALELMVSVRYLRLLSRLDAVVGGELGWGEHEPGRKRLRRRTEREWVRVHGRYDAAYADAQDGEPTAAALHEVRKAVKRLRYAGEAVEPMFGRAAATLAAHAEEIQTVLGEHQDSVVAQRVLRDLALAAHRSGTDTFTYGRLHGLEDGAAAATRHRFAEAWSRLEKLDPSTVLR
jgi:CHAD domain-containing protein